MKKKTKLAIIIILLIIIGSMIYEHYETKWLNNNQIEYNNN